MSSPLPASAVNHVDALQPGARLGEFEVLSLLGVGGFGMVYRAFDHSLMRFVAIKEYLPSALAGRTQGQTLWVRSSADEQSYQAGLASFVNEARLLAQYDHPSLVKVFRFWEANQTAYMVMPLYGGMTLKQARAHMRTPPPEAWLRKVLWSVLGALRVLHDAQMLHRDVSPDNIFLQDVGPPVLLDLGAARRAISDRDRQHTAVLKVNYAPIEQYTDAGSDLRQGPWSDLYSLAAVMHGCICNDTPLPATLRAIRDRMVPFDRVARTVQEQFGIEYSAAFVQAMSQALQLRPQDRPQSIDAFAQLLELQAPAVGLEHFDFRAELGSIWVDPGSADGPAPPALVPQDMAATSTTRVSQPLAQVLAAQTAVVVAPPFAPSPAQPSEPLVAPAPGPAPQPGVQPVSQPTVASPLPPAAVDVDLVLGSELASALHAPPAPPVPPAPEPAASAPTARAADRGRAPLQAPRSTAPAGEAAGKGAPSRTVVFALLGLLVVAAIALVFWWRAAPKQPPRTPDDQIITEMADAATAPVSAALPAASAAAAVPAVAAPAAQAASVEAPPPAFVTAPAARPAKAVTRRETPVAAAAPAATAPVAEAAPAAPAPPATPAPAASSRPARPPNPSETCASASLLTRPMCVHRECQVAGAGSYPVCVENRRRQEEEARKREMFSQ